MSEPLRLNIGAGPTAYEGYENVDIKAGQDAAKLCYQDNSVEDIYASHVLEHWPYGQTLAVLKEWVRVLKPGGVLRVAVPDFDLITDAYRDGKNWNTEGYLLGGQCNQHDIHYAIFTRGKLEQLLRAAGLRKVRRWTPTHQDCSSLPCSLNLEGYKLPPRQANGKDVYAVMSMPRLAFTDNFFCAFKALAPLHIPLAKGCGVFWGQVLTRMIGEAMEAGCKYVLTIDYDTVFERQDVEFLYELMEDYPEIDALVPLQMKREAETALFTVKNPDGSPVDKLPVDLLKNDVMPISSGHFGLTMLRVDALNKTPHPWFLSIPDSDGKWGDGRVDEDSYFWRNWQKQGHTIYSANCSIGHIQRVVTWADKGLKPRHQMLDQYETEGKPEYAI